MSDTTEAVQRLPSRGLLGPALAALQWAGLAAWLLELHEDQSGARISLARATLATDLRPDPRAIAGELETLDALRARWTAATGPETARVAALDAVRRALHACLDCLDADAAERDAGVRETLTLTLRAWGLYGGHSTPEAFRAAPLATYLAPYVVAAAMPAPNPNDGPFNGGPVQ